MELRAAAVPYAKITEAIPGQGRPLGSGLRICGLRREDPGQTPGGSRPPNEPSRTDRDMTPDTTSVPMALRDVVDAVIGQHAETQHWLAELVRIPSISSLEAHTEDMQRSAQQIVGLLRSVGLEDAQLLTVPGAPPAITASWQHAPPGAPTVLLYAHHDVQPVSTADRWRTPPFEPTVNDGRLYGRGAADDKAGVLLHVAAIRAWLETRDALPVNVVVLIEGEEEVGSPHLDALLATHHELLDADVIVLADLVNRAVGWPSLTTSLRGLGEATVTVRTLDVPVHSGLWGGLVPDALTATARLLATLHNADGTVAVPGFVAGATPRTPTERAELRASAPDPDELRRDAGLRPGVRLLGPGPGTAAPTEALWFQPTITPTAMDVPPVQQAANNLLAEVTTQLSCRFAPGQDPDAAMDALREHLLANAPFGAEVEVALGERAPAWEMPTGGPVWDAAVAALTAGYGRAPAQLGCGGSIPFVGPFSAAFDGAPCLLVGVEDPTSNAHGENESVHLEDHLRACVSEVVLFHELAARWRDG